MRIELNIRKSLSSKLSLAVMLLAVPIFVVSLGVLFSQSRFLIRKEAVGRANSVLSVTMQRLCRNLITIETATRTNSWLVGHHLQPDSLLALSNRIVRLNPHIDGCSISAEPDVFPEYGRYFSVYSVRQGDSVATVIEEEYEYFEKVWYKSPRQLDGPCWEVYYDEADSLELTIAGMIASYGMPLYDNTHRFVGIISTDLSLLRLSKVISEEEKPYPNAYFMMIDKDGHFYVHPDSDRLFTQTIFSGADPQQQADLIALGHEMTDGKSGHMMVAVDGIPSLVCYQPVPGTSWSLALVCPDSDVLAGYHKFTLIMLPLLIVGLLLIMLLCHRAVSHAIRPIGQLLLKTQSIAAGNMEVYIAPSRREDAVGRLQNSFATMLQSLNFHMGSVRYTTEQTERRNEQLAQATHQVEEADRQKTAFIQNVTHQIRTPLNIIMGFAQVLSDTAQESLSGEEMKSVIETMDHNAKVLSRMVTMLFDSSDMGWNVELNSHQHDQVPCNDVVREAIGYLAEHYPGTTVNFQSEVADDFCLQTNRIYLMRCLRELLYNAAKYSDGQHIMLRVTTNDAAVCFIVEDTGKGLSEADRELIFKFFSKVDDLSEGLGLGLPLAKRHACNMGGDLTLDTSYHDGCRFVLTIPIHSSVAVAATL
jgi:signal transduction histidine kinase